jgi:hypothetical protein
LTDPPSPCVAELRQRRIEETEPTTGIDSDHLHDSCECNDITGPIDPDLPTPSTEVAYKFRGFMKIFVSVA